MPRLLIPGVVLATLWGLSSASAVTPPQPDGARLLRDVERLSSVGRVLYVAAHPDDENTRLLSWLVEHEKVRAAYLSLTRGEGGQNLIGAEIGPLLGVIRTQELLAARGIDGAEQLFGLERDFGYSKTAEETLRIWGKNDALGDVVWNIRRFQPDVIVTRFSPEDRETHGHHTSSAILALEAFTVAADPKAFPEQLQWVQPWQAKRIVWNKGVFGPAKPDALDGFLAMDIGGFDPLLGESYPEIAARSRTMHKSQGFGSTAQRGPALEYFKLLAGEPFKDSFLDGVDLTWGRVKGAETVRTLLAQVRSDFNVQAPSASIPMLLNALDALDALPANSWQAHKHAAIARVVAACAGLDVDALAVEQKAIPGGDVKVALTAMNRSDAKWALHSVRIGGEEKVIDQALEKTKPVTAEWTVKLPAGTPPSNPYWLMNDPSAGRWTVNEQELVGLPGQPPPLVATFAFTVAGHPLELTRPVVYSWTDPVMGERRRQIEVLPAVTINVADRLLMFPDTRPKELQVAVRATKGVQSGTLSPTAPAGFAVTPASLPFKVTAGEAEQTLTFQVKPTGTLKEPSGSVTGMLKISGTLADGSIVERGIQTISHPHIPIQTLTPLATVKLTQFNLKRAFSRIGYIPGAGDEVPSALRQVGYEVTMLSDEVLANGKLDGYQAIVVGVRAFNVNEALPRFHSRLMAYVEKGGTLLVQYNTQNRISKVTTAIGPWPFNISQDRVTDETADVERLVPEHAIFTTPNRILNTDFNDWVQERGLYFAGDWDAHYQPLIAMHDPGETPKKGALLLTSHGKGTMIYTGLAFFRQLPAGVPGAFRLFANLLSHAR